MDLEMTDQKQEFQPKIVAFLCNWCSYAGADLAGIGRFQYPPSVRVIRVPCSGRINPLIIIKALISGADGVLISGCHPGDCHYLQGNYVARRKFTVLKGLLKMVGSWQDRVFFSWVSAAEGQRFAEVITEVTESILEQGPNRSLVKRIPALAGQKEAS
jgi:F420-non-reducing hydrogenase iron-sulfur subunit